MKRSRAFALLAIGLTVAALLAACGGSSSGTGNTGTPAANVATATATAKPKPTGVPTINATTCAGWMSVDEANSLMMPPASATSIVADNGPSGGSCNYEASKTNIPLVIFFLDWNGPDPIPQSDIQAALDQAAGTHLTINVATPVTGVGDQAEYVEATGSYNGSNAVMHIFYVLEGPFIFDCFTYSPITAGFLGTQQQLQQCATQVDSRL